MLGYIPYKGHPKEVTSISDWLNSANPGDFAIYNRASIPPAEQKKAEAMTFYLMGAVNLFQRKTGTFFVGETEFNEFEYLVQRRKSR